MAATRLAVPRRPTTAASPDSSPGRTFSGRFHNLRLRLCRGRCTRCAGDMDAHLHVESIVPSIDDRIGFRVWDSVVVALLRGSAVAVAARLDCEQVRTDPGLVQLRGIAERNRIDSYAALVIDPFDPTLVRILDHPEFGIMGLPCVWKASVDGGRWTSSTCRQDCDHHMPRRAVLSRDDIIKGLKSDQVLRSRVAVELRRRSQSPAPGHVAALLTLATPLAVAEIADIARALCDVEARDGLITSLTDAAACDDEVWPTAYAALSEVLRGSPAELTADVAAVCAFAAWQAGDGMRTRLCVRMALDQQPNHRLAGLLDQVIGAGLPPQAWAEAGLQGICDQDVGRDDTATTMPDHR